MPANFDPLAAEIGEMDSVVDSAAALMDGFETRLSEAITADNLADDSNVAQFRDTVAAQKTKLADAVARNTPGQPTT